MHRPLEYITVEGFAFWVGVDNCLALCKRGLSVCYASLCFSRPLKKLKKQKAAKCDGLIRKLLVNTSVNLFFLSFI